MKRDKKYLIDTFGIPICNGRLWVYGFLSPFYDDEYANGDFIIVPIGEEWIDEFGKVYNAREKIFYTNYKKYVKYKDVIIFTRKLYSKAYYFKLYKNLKLNKVGK
jgi:hypothetical protein